MRTPPSAAAWLVALCTACSSDAPLDPMDLDSLVLQVVYEEGAEPYTGAVGPTQGDTWSLYANNAAALFDGTGVTPSSPSSLDGMASFPDDGVDAYDSAALIALAQEHGSPGRDGSTRTLTAVWVDGRFLREGEPSDSVLGVSIGDTSVLAVFKPVVESLGALELVRRFGEQTTLIHEVGHAIGLVNNGVEPTSDHHDEANGAHCTNDACVMYWANEGPADLAQFVQQYVTSGSAVVFADDCLDDVAGHYGSE